MWLAYCLTLYLIILSVVYYTNYDFPSPERGELVCRTYRDKVYIFLVFAPLILFSCLRGEMIGSDTPNYAMYYELISGHVITGGFGVAIATRLEPGFIFLIKVLSLITPSPQILIITTSLFFMCSFVRFISKYSIMPWLSAIMFFTLFFNGSMNVMRQYISIGILLFSFDYILQNKFKKFLILVFLAVMFHYTSIVFLGAYFLRNMKVSSALLKKVLGFLPVVVVLSYVLLRIVLGIFHAYGLYDYYDDQNEHIAGGAKLATAIELLLALLVIFISNHAWGILRHDTSVNLGPVNNILFLFSLVGLGMIAISFPFNLLSRLGTFFLIFNCVLLPNAVYEMSKQRNVRFLCIFLCVLYCSYYLVVNTIRPEWSSIYPYSFY